ncbi:MAG: STAS domain-containing protein [Actinobacteria bacterium]|nr:STAS domain-containing protein [Actinomycetota bacterium]
MRVSRPSFSVVIGRALGTVVVTVHGGLDAETSPRLRRVLADLIDAQGNLDVVVDLADTTQVSPSGLSALLEAARSAHRRGGQLRLSRRSHPACQGLLMMGTDSLISMIRPYDDGPARRSSGRRGGDDALSGRPPAEVSMAAATRLTNGSRAQAKATTPADATAAASWWS